MNNTLNLREISLDIGAIATKAILYEVSCFPSPGLVSPVSSGSHKDMNYYTFIDSTFAINKYLTLFANEGMKEEELSKIFLKIKKIGIEAEKAMFNSTKNVNTHKGMIFLIGICTAASSYAIYHKKGFSHIQNIIKTMCRGITKNDFRNLDKKQKITHGEKLYLQYGITGIRGEVEKGIPLAFNYGLELYENSLSLEENERLVHTLIGIMQFCDDSTVIHRRGIDGLNYVKNISKEIMNLGGMKTDFGRRMINKLNDDFIDKNISPGGSADILGVTIFLHFIKEYMQGLIYHEHYRKN